MTNEELVKKLRETPHCQCDTYSDVKITDEAADAIARFQADLKEAVEALKKLTIVYEGMETGDGEPCPDLANAAAIVAKHEGTER